MCILLRSSRGIMMMRYMKDLILDEDPHSDSYVDAVFQHFQLSTLWVVRELCSFCPPASPTGSNNKKKKKLCYRYYVFHLETFNSLQLVFTFHCLESFLFDPMRHVRLCLVELVSIIVIFFIYDKGFSV